jgi:hypothetical protein
MKKNTQTLAVIAVAGSLSSANGVGDYFQHWKEAFAKLESLQVHSSVSIEIPGESVAVKRVTYKAEKGCYKYELHVEQGTEQLKSVFAYNGKQYQLYDIMPPERHMYLSTNQDSMAVLVVVDMVLTPFQFLLHESDKDDIQIPRWRRPVKLTELRSDEFWRKALTGSERTGEAIRNGRSCVVLKIGKKLVHGKEFYYKVFLDKGADFYPVAFEKIANGDTKVAIYDVEELEERETAPTKFIFPKKAKLFRSNEGNGLVSCSFLLNDLDVNKPIGQSEFTLDLLDPDDILDNDSNRYLPPFENSMPTGATQTQIKAK